MRDCRVAAIGAGGGRNSERQQRLRLGFCSGEKLGRKGGVRAGESEAERRRSISGERRRRRRPAMARAERGGGGDASPGGEREERERGHVGERVNRVGCDPGASWAQPKWLGPTH